MYCINCGKEIDEKGNFCINCGTKVVKTDDQQKNVTIINNYQTTKPVEAPEDKKKADTLCVISLVLMYAVPTVLTSFASAISSTSKPLYSIFSGLSSMSCLAGIVLMIVARVKYPHNVFAKVLMWIYIIFLGFGIIAVIVFTIACAIACHDVDTSGCG